MPWAKGQSGNPGGRPRELAGIQKLARENAPLAIQTLVEVASNGKSESARVSAATALLDRGFGKPAQFSTSDPGNFRKATEMTDDELVAIIDGSRRAACLSPISFSATTDTKTQLAPSQA